ncbi:hypothetical protein CDAR_56651 [Caerostris darwini]|uniref:Uncharacterized protein n=1 Tax=Caerostris darwini TaxID=1538125 RepID=A0AAV4RK25_9ARAC|nr:hypothetical protein CDAR_56651 [Caerostris darwini]
MAISIYEDKVIVEVERTTPLWRFARVQPRCHRVDRFMASLGENYELGPGYCRGLVGGKLSIVATVLLFMLPLVCSALVRLDLGDMIFSSFFNSGETSADRTYCKRDNGILDDSGEGFLKEFVSI